VFRLMRHEAGVHRVQRVPKTERNGRIHTSTISVQVIPIFRQDELQLDKSSVRMETMRSQGAGGQNVNKTESCVRITHLPSGISVECQEQRSQEQNKTVAMQKLIRELSRRRADELRQDELRLRRSQVQSVERSDKIRTYNYPQDRITEHRLRQDLHNLRGFMKGECGSVLTEWLEQLHRTRRQSIRDQLTSRLQITSNQMSRSL
jgi:peptide chain release factor 1